LRNGRAMKIVSIRAGSDIHYGKKIPVFWAGVLATTEKVQPTNGDSIGLNTTIHVGFKMHLVLLSWFIRLIHQDL